MSEQWQAAHRRNVYGEDGWTQVSCVVADLIRLSPHVTPASGKTDLDGQFGEPEVYTEWATRKTEIPVLREHRWPSLHAGEPNPYRCEHYAPKATP